MGYVIIPVVLEGEDTFSIQENTFECLITVLSEIWI